MERSLDPALLSAALGTTSNLPSSSELAAAISEAEIALLLNRGEVPPDLASLGWFLHSVGSALPSLELYGVERQRAAFQVAGHILDLALQGMDESEPGRLSHSFAAQVAYLRCEIDPNALAVYRRELLHRLAEPDRATHPSQTSLSLGCALLAIDSGYLFPSLRRLQSQLAEIDRSLEDAMQTVFAASAGVVRGVRDLHVYLVYGRADRLQAARDWLSRAANAESSQADADSRWVAAHLLMLIDGLETASVWGVLPPNVPDSVRRAFAQGHPRVATLWPPQIDVVGGRAGIPDPFAPETRRLVLSMPTSAGKTLLSQLMITSHLASGAGGVCYVAPTRSLCAEVRRSLDERLRFLDFRTAPDLPDFVEAADLGVAPPPVEVMTPERLSFLLHRDAGAVLERFTLFVFDEVHTVSDQSRGWVLESLISFLHYRTLNSTHKIVGMSAALGNQAHFVSWLSGNDFEASSYESNWRGPRRLHCVWTTDVDWRHGVDEERRSPDWPVRQIYPLRGVLHARTSYQGQLHNLSTTEPIGQLAFRTDASGRREREPSHTTPFYLSLVPLVGFLGVHGPVLAIESTKPRAMDLARAIARDRRATKSPSSELRDLTAFVALRLGPEHPLLEVLPAGVAYHHGSLPLDIRTAVEDALRNGVVNVLVATTSLTEGVNLPVRSVVVASQGMPWSVEDKRLSLARGW